MSTWTILMVALLACGDKGGGGDGGTDGGGTDGGTDGGGDGGSSMDADGDGYDDAAQGGDDCDDGNADVNPGATEVCNDIDDNCDGTVDEDSAADASTWYGDADRDGFGDDASTTTSCQQPPDSASHGGDCDDNNADIHPTATEICNSVDDDCNDLVDDADPSLDASTATTWFADTDGDGFGDIGMTAVACADPWGGSVLKGGDCDDDNADVHPGATEVCDGLDNDCDASTGEDGTVLWRPATGPIRDLTSTFAAGTVTRPATWRSPADGALSICAGTWYASLNVVNNVQVNGPAGAGATTLDGGGVTTVLVVDGDGITVSASGLTVQNGTSSVCTLLEGALDAGGAACCQGVGSSLAFSDGSLLDSSATVGALMSSSGCDLSFERATLSGGAARYGGALFTSEGTTTFTDSIIADNVAGTTGGAGYLGLDAGVDITLDGTVVTGNSALYAGAWYIDDSILDLDGLPVADSLRCVAAADGTGGIYGNTASYGGGIYFWEINLDASPDVVESDACDWGTSAGGDDNTPDDLGYLGYMDTGSYGEVTAGSYGDDATFRCASGSCLP